MHVYAKIIFSCNNQIKSSVSQTPPPQKKKIDNSKILIPFIYTHLQMINLLHKNFDRAIIFRIFNCLNGYL